MVNYILAYYQGIQDGSIVVGKWIRLFFEYIIRGLEAQSFYFDQKKQIRQFALLRTSAITVREEMIC